MSEFWVSCGHQLLDQRHDMILIGEPLVAVFPRVVVEALDHPPAAVVDVDGRNRGQVDRVVDIDVGVGEQQVGAGGAGRLEETQDPRFF